jgi:hypothetical protein
MQQILTTFTASGEFLSLTLAGNALGVGEADLRGASCLVGWVSPFYVGQFDAHVAEQLDYAIRSLVGKSGAQETSKSSLRMCRSTDWNAWRVPSPRPTRRVMS